MWRSIELADKLRDHFKERTCKSHNLTPVINPANDHVTVLTCCDKMKQELQVETVAVFGEELVSENIRFH